jgi:hypothetical protein
LHLFYLKKDNIDQHLSRFLLHETRAMHPAFLLCSMWAAAVCRPALFVPDAFPDAFHLFSVDRHFEGMTVKRYACAAALGLWLSGAVHAAAIDLDNSPAVSAAVGARMADLSALPRNEVVRPPSASMSELPEPEVFAMMLVGLILIGYRASRDSSDKFE